MLETELTKRALKIANEGHAGQVDRGGMPYILHPISVAERVDGEARTTSAILHDLLEDTEITAEDLLKEGIPETVVDTVKLLTRTQNEPYREYIRRIAESGNADAVAVKYADLCHNLDETRLAGGKLPERLKVRYREAQDVLRPLL